MSSWNWDNMSSILNKIHDFHKQIFQNIQLVITFNYNGYVTSRSSALRKPIIWGHLLASDLDFLMLKHLYLIMMRYDRRHDVLLFDVDRCYWLSCIECAGFWILRMQRYRWNPLDSGFSQEVCYLGWFIYCDISLIWWFDVDMFWHDYRWCRLMIACRPNSHME